MGIGKASDFKVYNDEFFGGVSESLQQVTDVFNAAGRGAIQLIPAARRGDFAKESFYQALADGGISRRDTTSTETADDTELTQEELISVKLNRKIGPIANTLDSFRKIQQGATDQALSFLMGAQVGKGMMVDYLDAAATAFIASVGKETSNTADKTASPGSTLTTEYLFDGLAKMGDAQNRIVAWMMHSKAYSDLVKEQALTTKIEGIANFNIETGTPVTLNRPVIMTDCSALVDTNSPGEDNYYILGMTANAIVLEQSEDQSIESQIITGLENLIVRLQGEYAYNLTSKGFKFSTSHANPTLATLGTEARWTKVASSHKDIGGVVIKVGPSA